MSNDEKSTGAGFFSNPTKRLGRSGSDKTVRNTVDSEAETERVAKPLAQTSSAKPAPDEQRTRRVRPTKASDDLTSTDSVRSDGAYEPEFVVGWLVVVDGPGRGASRALGYGFNPIGREEHEGVRLNFGDAEISRKSHCQIAFDHKNAKFFIQHGGGQNLTYVGDSPVLSQAELVNGDEISVGNTKLLLVQLCSDDFRWE